MTRKDDTGVQPSGGETTLTNTGVYNSCVLPAMQARTQDFLKGGSKWKGKKLKINDHCQCTNHFGMGFGARLRAPEAGRLCLVHSRSFL